MAETGVKYRRIFETLQRELAEGKYGPGRPFPSEAQLVRRFGVSRFTAVQAVNGLVKAGLVIRRKGKGSFPTRYARVSAGPIGLILPGLAYGEIYAPICSEITRLCQQRGRTVLLGNTDAETAAARAAASKRLAQDFVRQRVSGVIMQPIEYLRDNEGANREIISIFERASVPVVLIDYDIVPPPQRSDYDLVGIDNFAAGRRLGDHLVGRGAKNVLYLKRANCAPTIENRLLGVAAALASAGRRWTSANVLVGEPDDGARLLRRLRQRPRPDALVCGYDVHAAHALKVLERAGLSKKLRLAAFDDVRCASVMSPALTTVRQPCVDIAKEAVETLMRRLAHPDDPVRTVLLDAPLVVREST